VIDVSVIVLTMGDRADELAAAIASTRAQPGIEIEVVLVVNRGDPDTSAVDVVVRPETNVGIPGGRNAGAHNARGRYLAFLDDDAVYLDRALSDAVMRLDRDHGVGALGFRIVDEAGQTSRRYDPRIGRSRGSSGGVTSFPGGACMIRSDAFSQAGGFCDAFGYSLEETDLAWQLIDAKYRLNYASDLTVRHPHTSPTRHGVYHHHTGRNRVWLAWRRLPLPIAATYLVNWAIVTSARNWRDRIAMRAYLRGTIDGLRNRTGPRRPMSWRTVVRMARLGRPPII
jgi:GT2 family glycosyltransferase